MGAVSSWVEVILTMIQAISAAIVAVLTIFLFFLTKKTVKAYQDQVAIGQQQINSQFRPVVYPLHKLEAIMDSGVVYWGRPVQSMKGYQNIGVGPAFCIYAILFGKPDGVGNPPTERYVTWNYGVLPPGKEGPPIILERGTSVESTNIIDGYSLYVPDDPDHNGVVARLTITYRDIFGRKFASMYDYQNVLGWLDVNHAEGIPYDLLELDNMHSTTQMSRRFFYQLGKNRPKVN